MELDNFSNVKTLSNHKHACMRMPVTCAGAQQPSLRPRPHLWDGSEADCCQGSLSTLSLPAPFPTKTEQTAYAAPLPLALALGPSVRLLFSRNGDLPFPGSINTYSASSVFILISVAMFSNINCIYPLTFKVFVVGRKVGIYISSLDLISSEEVRLCLHK